MRWKQAIIIGASSGLGAELARQLVSQGTKVAGVARRSTELEDLQRQLGDNFVPVVHDATHFDSVNQVFLDTTEKLGGLDLVIYCAGVMPEVGPEEFSFEKDQQMIQVNCSGAVAWLNIAAERFQAVGAGTLVGIGSVAGDRGRRGQPVYNASKAFLHTYLEALRNRLSEKGVTVVTVKPGPVDTAMTKHLNMKKMPVGVAASTILKNLTKSREVYLSPVHRLAFSVIRLIPTGIFQKMKI